MPWIETAKVAADVWRESELSKLPYVDRVHEQHKGLGFWEYLKYDQEGDLYFQGIKVVDILSNIVEATNGEHTGTPVEIVDPRITTKRGKEFIEMSRKAAVYADYQGGLEYFYATKASPTAEITVAALTAGWKLEVSDSQDIVNIMWLQEQGLLPRNIKVICNGFKFDPDDYKPFPVRPDKQPIIVGGEVADVKKNSGDLYANLILEAKRRGINVVPVFDSADEIRLFAESGIKFDVGVRLKAYDGIDGHYDSLISRHGSIPDQLTEMANIIDQNPNLTLTTFHSMIGAAKELPMHKHVEALMKAADIYFKLKKEHPSLREYNMGGGITPLGTTHYDHKQFLRTYMIEMKKRAKKHGLKEPVMQFEFGSLMAAEAAIAATRVIKFKENDTDLWFNKKIPWAIIDYSIMRGLIDEILMDGRYVCLAANYGNIKAIPMRVGDKTCDHDGHNRTDEDEKQYVPKNTVLLPDIRKLPPEMRTEPLILVFVAIQAYEETLTGIGGVGHSSQDEPIDAVLWIDQKEQIRLFLQKFNSPAITSHILGFKEGFLNVLRSIRNQR
jgi:arginine decarboxylase